MTLSCDADSVRPDRSPAPVAALQDLAELYADLARELAALQVACSACGQCCRFDRVDHVLYASLLEAVYLQQEDGPRAPRHPQRCPYQEDDACVARAGRVLGCRLHFCLADHEQALRLEELSAETHRRLQAIHEQHGLPWRYEPLLQHLRQMAVAEGGGA